MLWAAFRKVNAKREVPRHSPASRIIANATKPRISDENDIAKVKTEEAQRGAAKTCSEKGKTAAPEKTSVGLDAPGI
jgi:hypothetical protein